jgi:hypothetical protein
MGLITQKLFIVACEPARLKLEKNASHATTKGCAVFFEKENCTGIATQFLQCSIITVRVQAYKAPTGET